jgi:hypothetical protein
MPTASAAVSVGITFCPGKYDRHAMTDFGIVELDLDAIRDWGAAAVVTLLEPNELTLLRVERLGEGVIRRNIRWFHLPIVDISIPDENLSKAGPPPVKNCAQCCAASSTCWFTARRLEDVRGGTWWDIGTFGTCPRVASAWV